MKSKTKSDAAVSASHAEEARRLIEAAAKKPGVAELFKVYKAWQEFDPVIQAQSRLAATKQRISTSDSSMPVFLQAA